MSRLLPVFAAAATGILVGLAIVATRFVLDQTQPASLALMRYTIGVCCLAPALWASARVRFIRRDILPIMFLGTFQFGVLIVLMNHGLKYIPSARAALIFATMPFLTLILSALAGREKLRLTQAAGVALTILGVGLALGDKAALDVLSSAWLGDLAVFGSALCGASCSVLYQPYLRKYPTLQVSFLAMAASVLFLILPAGWEGLFNSFPSITPGRVGGRGLYRAHQRGGLLSLAMGSEPHHPHQGDHLSGPEPPHGRVLRSPVSGGADHPGPAAGPGPVPGRAVDCPPAGEGILRSVTDGGRTIVLTAP